MRSINNDQNIIRVYTKMSEDFHHENSSKLSKCAKTFDYFNEINNVESDSSEEEINVVDHMYATNVENGTITDETNDSPPFNCQTSAESEVKLIKEWLILHTDLIQQQNDDILDKDREIYILRKENEMLKERINCIEKGIPFQIQKSSSENIPEEVIVEDMTQGPLKDEVHEEVQIVQPYSANNDCSLQIIDYKSDNCVNLSDSESQINNSVPVSEKKYEENIVNSVIELNSEELLLDNIEDSWKPKSDYLTSSLPVSDVSDYSFTINNISEFDPMKNLRMSIRRKRVTSNSSGLSHNESINEEKETYRRRYKKKKRRLTTDTNVLTSLEAYVTQSHEVNLGIPTVELEITDCVATSLEVPRWRHKIYASCYTMEGTENLDDEVYNKRHMRLENDERRRKRWDVQRIREQRVIEKLKQRQERVGLGSKGDDNDPVLSLWPKLEDIKFLEVSDELPVAAFGHPISKFNPSEFQVPWMDNPSVLTKKTHSRKSKMKRRSSKR